MGFRDVVDKVTSLRNARATRIRNLGPLTPKEEARFAGALAKEKKLARMRSLELQRRFRETLRSQGVASIGVIQTALDMLPECLGTAYEIMVDPTQSASDRLACAKWLTERALARPQDLGGLREESADLRSPAELTAQELRAMMVSLQGEIAARQASAPIDVTPTRETEPQDSDSLD